MSTLARTRLRLAGDAANFDAPLDALRRATPQFWRGNDVQFELAVFFNGALQDVSNLASLTLEIRPLGSGGAAPDPGFTPLMGATITSFDNSTTLDTWNSGAKQHAVVAFTAAQSNIVAGPAWLSIFVITNDSPGRVITLCAGPVRVLEDGSGLATTPSPAGDTFYTAAQSDARFAPLGGGGDGGGSGTVTSVGLSVPSFMSVAGTPVTTSGTLAVSLATQSANTLFSGPTSGSTAAPTFRALVAADIPAIAQSGVTGLTSALAALAPLASPQFSASVKVATSSAYTLPDSSTAVVTINGPTVVYASSSGPGVGNIFGVVNTNTSWTGDTAYIQSLCASGISALDFLDDSSSSLGAIGYANASSSYIASGAMYLSCQPPWTSPSYSIPTSGVGKFFLVQEGMYGGGYRQRGAYVLNSDWSIDIQDPMSNRMGGFLAPANSGAVEFNIEGTAGGPYSGSAAGSGSAAQFSAKSSDGNYGVLASYNAAYSYHAYPATGAAVFSTGSGGLMVAATNGSGIIKFLTGGDSSTNERLRIDSAGNLIFSNSVTSAPVETLANGQYEITVYDNGSTPVLRCRYKDGSGTIKVGDLGLS